MRVGSQFSYLCWLTKLQKNVTFNVAAPNCSLKPLSKAVNYLQKKNENDDDKLA